MSSPSSPIPSSPRVARIQYREMRAAVIRGAGKLSRARDQVVALRKVINRQAVEVRELKDSLERLADEYGSFVSRDPRENMRWERQINGINLYRYAHEENGAVDDSAVGSSASA